MQVDEGGTALGNDGEEAASGDFERFLSDKGVSASTIQKLKANGLDNLCDASLSV